MALTPEEIEQHTFRERFRGYDPDEVDAFLDRVVSALRTLEQERDAARRERDVAVAERDRAHAGAGESEELLRRTLVSAQRTAEQTVAEANADAERIRGQAQEEAERLLGEARAHAYEIADAVEELVGVHGQLRQSLRALLAEHAERIEQEGELPPAADLAARLRELADATEWEERGAPAAEREAAELSAEEPGGWPGPPGEGSQPPAEEPPTSYPPPPR